MKKYGMLALALLAALAVSGAGAGKAVDAAELVSVQLLCIDAQEGTIRLKTDTGDTGSGKTMDEALADLKAGCAGQLFTQTATHVLLTSRAWYLAPQVCVNAQLRPAARVYRVNGEAGKTEALLAFLQAHPGTLTLSRMRALFLQGEQVRPEVIVAAEGGFRLGA